MDPRLPELIEAADLNALLRAVDALCHERAWDDLLDLADRCEEAVERGKQLWPIAAHIDYRVALEAPGEYAAKVLDPGVGRFSHGPLTEVAASSHTWDELADHIEFPQAAAYVAQERVLRGEDLTGDERAGADVLEMPLRLVPWEPTYALAVFRSDHVEVSEVWEPKAPLADETAAPGEELGEPEIEAALLDLVQPWTAESNGAARAIVVDGDARTAIAALASPGAFRIGRLLTEEAVQRLAWAAASGGARGRRRGAAFGRFMAWYVCSLVTGRRWPPDPADLGAAIARLNWFRWDEGEPEKGWVLRLALEHRAQGWAAAIAATDVLEDAGTRPA